MRAMIGAACAAMLLATALPAAAKDRPLFESDTVLNLSLSGPIDRLPRKAGAAAVPAVLKVEGPSPETLPVSLTTRGVTRKMAAVCAFPPVRVIFTQKPPKESIFRGQKALKLVTHCQAKQSYEQGVLLEYATYRLYRALTPESFGARLVKMNYVDAKGGADRWAFFIEDVKDMAERNGKERLRGFNTISQTQLDPVVAGRFAAFQYMISNLDWAMTAGQPGEDCCHNSRLIGAAGATSGMIGVPYDFDYAGLVDAEYAVPPNGIRVANVRVRLYRGFCSQNSQAQAAMANLLSRRAELTGILDQTPGLDDFHRKKADAYLGEFFDEISSPQKVSAILQGCLP